MAIFDELLMKSKCSRNTRKWIWSQAEKDIFRLTAFGKREEILEAMEKMKRMFE